MTRTNTLAYFEKVVTYGRKKFYNIGPCSSLSESDSLEDVVPDEVVEDEELDAGNEDIACEQL